MSTLHLSAEHIKAIAAALDATVTGPASAATPKSLVKQADAKRLQENFGRKRHKRGNAGMGG